MAENGPKYTMKIRRSIVDKLGVKMYDTISAVVAELVANAYDADAENVEVRLPLNSVLARKEADGTITGRSYEMVVKDNGHGMTPEEMDKFYLEIGADRRKDEAWGDKSRKYGRPVMGRKGIGKLSAFGICRKIEVRSAGGEKTEKGYEVAHIIMDYDEILEESEEKYHPEPGLDDRSFDESSGTTIRLYDFLPKRVPNQDTFHRQLARRFGLKQSNFEITFYNNREGEPEEPTVVGTLDVPTMPETRVDVSSEPVVLPDGTELEVEGWIAFAEEAYPYEEIAGVRLYARGKLAATTRDFGISGGFTGEYTVRCYLVGEVHADWLDAEEDLVQTHRQDILWSSERGRALSEWGKKMIRRIGKSSRSPHRRKKRKTFMKLSDFERHARERFVDKDIQDAAIELGELIGGATDEEELKDEEFVAEIREFVLSVAPHRVLVDSIREIAEDETFSMSKLVGLFRKSNVAELCSYGQIARQRVKAIERLETALQESSEEKDLQEIIERAPWLIHPHWHPISANRPLENFRKSFGEWFREKFDEDVTTTAIGSETKKPDFVLLNFEASIEIVEIKRKSHTLTNKEWKRLEVYIGPLEDFWNENERVRKQFPGGVHATLVCDGFSLGRTERNAMEGLEGREALHERNWHEFLDGAREAQDDFLSERDRMRQLERTEEPK